MAKFQLKLFNSKKIGKKYVFSQCDNDNCEGPIIEHYPAQNATRLGLYTADNKFKFEVKINNAEGTSYSIKPCNKDGYPLGASIVVFDNTLFIGKFSSKEGFNGIVYRIKKDENIRVQEYKSGLLVAENITEHIIHEEVVYPLPFECVYDTENMNVLEKQNKHGEFIEYVAGNPDSRKKVLAASVDSDGTILVGQYKLNNFSGIAFGSRADGKVFLRTYTNGLPDGEFELVFANTTIEGVAMDGYHYTIKRKEDSGYIGILYTKMDEKFITSVNLLDNKKKIIYGSTMKLPQSIDPNAVGPKYQPPKIKTPPVVGQTGQEMLDNMIGLSGVKKEIMKLKALLHKFKGLPGKTNLNMCFYGNPGTGKTEVARIVAKILHEEGILPTNKFVETDSSGLIAEYVGQTAIKTHNVVQSAMGGVLFIDEAYQLSGGGYEGGSFGKDAIAALLKDMDDHRGEFCVILAGYKEPMDEMIAVNPGFKSRINNYIDFPDYSLDELCEITMLMAKNKGYSIDVDAMNEILKILNLYSMKSDFANGREVRNLLESLYAIQALRTFDESDNMDITLADVKDYEVDHNITFTKKSKKDEKPKKDWKISLVEYAKIANEYSDHTFSYSNDYIEEASVNIKTNAGEGSGFLISSKGIIGTCAHVVKGVEQITVVVNIKTASGQFIKKDYAAEVIALDSKKDVALIGIVNADFEFSYYPLAEYSSKYPQLSTKIVMGGYPLGGDRFASISLNQGLVQSINSDKAFGDGVTHIYVDISGMPGSSGSGVIDYNTGRCIAVFAGASLSIDGAHSINYAMPIQYLYDLIESIDKTPIIDEAPLMMKQCIKTQSVDYSMDYECSIDGNLNKYIEESNIHVVRGDVSTFRGDAVVNAANKYLAPGAGVCGAIFEKAGYRELQNECSRIGFCEVGRAVITRGYRLDASWIIHAVGPHYYHDENPEKLLEKVYDSIFKLALEKGIRTIALPSISTGTFRFPLDRAVPIAMKVIKKYANKFEAIHVYCYGRDDETYRTYMRYL